VVINERGEILFIHGSTGKYLEPAAGEASVNIMRMAREGLRRELTNAIRRVAARQEPVNYQGLRVKSNGETITVNLSVRPFEEDPAFSPGLLLVIFEEAPHKGKGVVGAEEAAVSSPAGQERIKALEQELQDKEEYLQSTFEELDTSNEELKSTNEELQSANEELGATNEELETSREELQSINEELLTVNAELQMKLDQLCQSNNNMENLLTGTNIGTIFVDTQMCLTFFTPAADRVVHIRQSDIGRPITHVVMNLEGYDRLAEDIQAVLNSLVPFELEVHSKENSWYLLRIMPFRTLENTIEGAVVTFIDITRRKKAEEELAQSEAKHRLLAKAIDESNSLRRMAVVVLDSNDAIAVQDLQGRILAWNPGAVRMYGWSESEALAMNMRKRIPKEQTEKELALLKKIALGDKIEPFQTQRLAKGGNSVKVWLTASALIDEAGKLYAISTTERKIG
jgi:two-component system CheB/CheR fusion protein